MIGKEERNEAYLKHIVTKIYNALKNLGDYVNREYPQIKTVLPNEITFITTQELEEPVSPA